MVVNLSRRRDVPMSPVSHFRPISSSTRGGHRPMAVRVCPRRVGVSGRAVTSSCLRCASQSGARWTQAPAATTGDWWRWGGAGVARQCCRGRAASAASVGAGPRDVTRGGTEHRSWGARERLTATDGAERETERRIGRRRVPLTSSRKGRRRRNQRDVE